MSDWLGERMWRARREVSSWKPWQRAALGIDEKDFPLNPSKYKFVCSYDYVPNEWYGEIKKESVMEWINGETYADRGNRMYRFIGVLDGYCYFLQESHEGVTKRELNGEFPHSSNFDIIRHVKPKKSVKGYVYMFEHPQFVYGMNGCLGVIRSEMTSYNADYVNACVPIEVEYTDGEGL